MAMTQEELDTKKWLKKHLMEEGYVTYAFLLDKYHLNLTSDPNVVAYMQEDKMRIVLNRNIWAEDISVVVRHEILHFYLQHELKLLKHLAKKYDLDWDIISDMTLGELKRELYSDDIFNKAADYHIANVGYTQEDEKIIQRLRVDNRTVTGLLTGRDHPDWIELGVEEMYDRLREEQPLPPKTETIVVYGKMVGDKFYDEQGNLVDPISKEAEANEN